MRRLSAILAPFTLLALLVLPAPAAAQGRDPAIEAVIAQQIEAFRANDLDRAFTFASPMIQSIFRTPQRFGVMVRNGYPMVWRPAEVAMGRLRIAGETRFQDVILRDMAGQLHIAEYEMIRVNGEWRINGVRLRRADLQGV